MLFTAIGFQKPVIASDDMNPEVFEQFHIGELFKSGDLNALRSTLEDFINHYDERASVYADELAKAGREYAPEAFARRIEKIIQEKA
jgi:glycosyltransferase involved in cell wall biosynthesis